jgi:hypothetical protein
MIQSKEDEISISKFKRTMRRIVNEMKENMKI